MKLFAPLLKLSIGCTAILALSGCPNMNDPYAPSPYDSGGYGYDRGGYGSGYDSGRDDYYRERDRDRKRDLQRERNRLEEERERLERERERNHDRGNDNWRPNTPPPSYRPERERCPSGFSPSENKCSGEERKRGCKDMRLPGGLGCVRR